MTNIRKFPSIKYPGDVDEVFAEGELIITEKLDGANFRWTYIPKYERFLFGSRNVQFKHGDEPLPKEQCNKNFRHAIEFVNNRTDFDIVEQWEDLQFFGEAMHKHSIEYDAWDDQEPDIESDTPNVVGFDIWDDENGEWLSYDEVEDKFSKMGIPTVPILHRIDAEEAEEEHFKIPKSEFREPDPTADEEFDQIGLAEGIVIKNDNTRKRAKKLHEYFKEKNAVVFNDPSKSSTMSGTFVARYVTNTRIEKTIHKLVDEAEYDEPEMPMMRELPKEVIKDIMAEEGWEIMNNDLELTVDVKDKIREKASRKCARVLKKEVRPI